MYNRSGGEIFIIAECNLFQRIRTFLTEYHYNQLITVTEFSFLSSVPYNRVLVYNKFSLYPSARLLVKTEIIIIKIDCTLNCFDQQIFFQKARKWYWILCQSWNWLVAAKRLKRRCFLIWKHVSLNFRWLTKDLQSPVTLL